MTKEIIYKMTLINNQKILISRNELMEIKKNDDKDFIILPRLGGGLINWKSIASILPAEFDDGIEQKEGYLHDGQRVIKQFGRWVLPESPETKLDPQYYPEVKKNTISLLPPKKQLT